MLYGLRTSPLAWEVERDHTLAQLQWEVEDRWYGLTPAKGNPCLWAFVELDAENETTGIAASSTAQSSEPTKEQPPTATKLRSIGIQTEGQERPVKLLGGLVTYVDDLLLAMPEVHLRPVVDLLLKEVCNEAVWSSPEWTTEEGDTDRLPGMQDNPRCQRCYFL